MERALCALCYLKTPCVCLRFNCTNRTTSRAKQAVALTMQNANTPHLSATYQSGPSVYYDRIQMNGKQTTQTHWEKCDGPAKYQFHSQMLRSKQVDVVGAQHAPSQCDTHTTIIQKSRRARNLRIRPLEHTLRPHVTRRAVAPKSESLTQHVVWKLLRN